MTTSDIQWTIAVILSQHRCQTDDLYQPLSCYCGEWQAHPSNLRPWQDHIAEILTTTLEALS